MKQQLRNGIARNWNVLKLNHSLKQPSIEDSELKFKNNDGIG